MPYRIVKKKGDRPWKIINKETGEQVGSSVSKEMAQKAIKARYAGKNNKIK